MATQPKLAHAIRLALLSSAVTAASLHTPAAISQDTALNEIVVTGSRIRRVEAETASPIFTFDRNAIEMSGVTTMGQLVQRVPSVSGAATNTSVNNGGGDGASTIELRGLSDERTLVLLNGRRVIGIAGTSGATGGAVDINQFPVNLIERVDVLKEGAGAIYGSDAIGGVVNFITRTEFDGLELGYDYGESSESDGARDNFSVAWGMDSDNGNVVISANYNTQEEISANDRDFARNALYLYGGVVTAGGSSRAPGGRIRFGGATPESAALAAQYGCGSVTLIERRARQFTRRLPLLHHERPRCGLLQLPAAQPARHAAGARELLHVGELQPRGRRRGVCGVHAQQHHVRLPDRGAAIRLPG